MRSSRALVLKLGPAEGIVSLAYFQNEICIVQLPALSSISRSRYWDAVQDIFWMLSWTICFFMPFLSFHGGRLAMGKSEKGSGGGRSKLEDFGWELTALVGERIATIVTLYLGAMKRELCRLSKLSVETFANALSTGLGTLACYH